MYTLKQIPADFIVEEIYEHNLKNNGKHIVYEIKKTNTSHFKMLSILSDKLSIPVRNIGYAGTKDKSAITTQCISIFGSTKEKIDRLQIEGIELKYLGCLNEPISLGNLKQNKFTITIRNIKNKPNKIDFFVNYFDEQRFGHNNVNQDIGKSIIKKQFKEAIELIINAESENNNQTSSKINEHLEKNKNDYVGALKILPKTLLMLYLHSYQSMLWNKTANQYIKQFKHKSISTNFGDISLPQENIENKEILNLEIPMIGFGLETNNPQIAKIIDEILKEEKITPRDFIIRQLANISCEGDNRKLFVQIYDLKIDELLDDELNKDMKKCTITFTLDKGCYATMAIRHMI